jgi:hypothetical protein
MSQPEPIRLKLKYRIGGRGRYSSGHGGNNRPARQHRQLTPAEIALHAAQPRKVMWLQPNGRIRMIIVSG